MDASKLNKISQTYKLNQLAAGCQLGSRAMLKFSNCQTNIAHGKKIKLLGNSPGYPCNQFAFKSDKSWHRVHESCLSNWPDLSDSTVPFIYRCLYATVP